MNGSPDGAHSASERTLAVLKDLLEGYGRRDFAVRLWDGTTWEADPGAGRRFTLVLQHPGALRRMLWPPAELTMAEAYIYNDCDIEGDMEGVFVLAEHLQGIPRILSKRWRLFRRLASLPATPRGRHGRSPANPRGPVHSMERDRYAVTYHYNTSNDFFRLWLDSRMVYSCAYFETPADDLETAQERKLDYLCRKLRLRPGDRFLDIGCGWGGLVLHAARSYGARALGITLSQPQVQLATARVREGGLETMCRVELRDYREMDETGAYDKIASVGMFEHVGESRLAEYFRRAWALLRPGGVFLNHGIAVNVNTPSSGGPSFSDRYVFPDGELLPINVTLCTAERAGFEVRDVESLREHYALTLRHWVRRLEGRWDDACRATDETTCRVWRLFMAGSAHGFSTGRLNVYQSMLVKPAGGSSGMPLTRADWYPNPTAAGGS